MKLEKIRDILDASIHNECDLNTDILTACGSDFMSDVLAFAKEQAVLLTGLVNLQVIRTADMMDMRAIVFVRGKQPDESMLALATERGIAVLSTPKRMYDACGLLYVAGLGGEQ